MGPLQEKVFSLRANAKITKSQYCFHSRGQEKKKKMKHSAFDICKANRVTIITFKKISMTSPSMKAVSHIAFSRGSETLHWAEG